MSAEKTHTHINMEGTSFDTLTAHGGEGFRLSLYCHGVSWLIFRLPLPGLFSICKELHARCAISGKMSSNIHPETNYYESGFLRIVSCDSQ